ncbi:SMI1/KNR4 family protein [Fusobacterium animalis]|uniref:SMI1/KNR4 family protein n=1 Tax=Fusobacterium animalis TaxID=76859 RepID=UPI0030CFF2B0
MTEFNWNNFINELKKFQKRIENIGGHIRETKIEAPAKEEEILEVEKKLGYSLPKDFRDVLLNYSSHFEYFWSTYKDSEEEQIEFPEKFCAIFAGNLHWGLDLLLDFEKSRKDWVDVCFPDYNNEYDKVWHNKLAFYKVANGDYFAIELEKEDYGKIVYLSHDGGDGHGHYLADNFKELLNNWSKVGCVGGDDWQWEPFYTEGKGIDPECENAKLWREYIFNNIRK